VLKIVKVRKIRLIGRESILLEQPQALSIEVAFGPGSDVAAA
jgi:hypothetical protein